MSKESTPFCAAFRIAFIPRPRFTFSMQVHGAREVCAEGAGVVHLDVRQVDADHPKDAAPLGRGKHAGKENFSLSALRYI